MREPEILPTGSQWTFSFCKSEPNFRSDDLSDKKLTQGGNSVVTNYLTRN